VRDTASQKEDWKWGITFLMVWPLATTGEACGGTGLRSSSHHGYCHMDSQ